MIWRARLRTVAPLAALCFGLFGVAQPAAADAIVTLMLVPDASDFVRDGAVLYDHHCSACHGDTGQGLAEARTSFPETHQVCTRCHRPTNPRTMPLGVMTARNAFDVGVAPAVVGEAAELAKFGTAAALLSYVQATMPRPFPGALTDEEYVKVVAFLLAANGLEVPEGVTASSLEGLSLR